LRFRNLRYLSIRSVASMDASLLDNHHSAEVFLLTTLISEACISPSRLYLAVPKQQLQTFQAHPGIEQLTGKGMPQAVNRVAFVLQPCLPKIVGKDIPGRRVT